MSPKIEAGQTLNTMDNNSDLVERVRKEVPEALKYLEEHPELKANLGEVTLVLEKLQQESETGEIEDGAEGFLDTVKEKFGLAEKEAAAGEAIPVEAAPVEAEEADSEDVEAVEGEPVEDGDATTTQNGKKIIKRKRIITKLKINTAGKTKEEIEQAKAEALAKHLERKYGVKEGSTSDEGTSKEVAGLNNASDVSGENTGDIDAGDAGRSIREEVKDDAGNLKDFEAFAKEQWEDADFRKRMGIDTEDLEIRKQGGLISQEEYDKQIAELKDTFNKKVRSWYDAIKDGKDEITPEEEAQAELAKGVKEAMESEKGFSFFNGYEVEDKQGENEVSHESEGRRSLAEKLKGFFKRSERVRKGSERSLYGQVKGWKKVAFAAALSVVLASTLGSFAMSSGAFAKSNEYKIPDMYKSANTITIEEETHENEEATLGGVVDAEIGETDKLSVDLNKEFGTEREATVGEKTPDVVKSTLYGEETEFNISAGAWSGESDYFSEAKVRNNQGEHRLTAPIYDIDHRSDYTKAELTKQGVEGLAQRLDDFALQGQFAALGGEDVQITGKVGGITSFEDMNFVTLMSQCDDTYRQDMAEYSKGMLGELLNKYSPQVETVQKGDTYGSLYMLNTAGEGENPRLQYFVDNEVTAKEDFEVLQFMDGDQNILDSNEIGGYKYNFLKAINAISEGASDEQATKIMSQYKILGISQLCTQIIWQKGGKTYITQEKHEESKPAPEQKIEETKDDGSAGNESAGNESAGNESAGNESAGDESAGNESTGVEIDGSAGNESAGVEIDGSAGNESAGNESAGNESAGNESAGDESAGDESAGNESAGDETGTESAGNESAGDENIPTGNESAGDETGTESAGNESAGDENIPTGNESAGDESAGFEGVVPKTEERTVKDTNPYVDPLPTTPEEATRGKEIVTEEDTGKIDEQPAGSSSDVAEDDFLNGGNKGGGDQTGDTEPDPTDATYDGSNTSGWQGDGQSTEQGTQDVQEPQTEQEIHDANNSEADQNTVPDTTPEQGDQNAPSDAEKADMMKDMF